MSFEVLPAPRARSSKHPPYQRPASRLADSGAAARLVSSLLGVRTDRPARQPSIPDHVVTEDTPDSFTGPASLDADTYRFGKDPDQDIRMVLATTQERGFCPPTVE